MEIPPRIQDVTHPTKPNRPPVLPPARTRRRIPRAAFLGGTVMALFLLSVTVYGLWNLSSPRHSLEKLCAAVERRDRDTIVKYVDAPRLAASFRDYSRKMVAKKLEPKPGDGFADRLVAVGAERILNDLIDNSQTPEALVDQLCGADPKEALKDGVHKSIDQGVDGWTQDGDFKVKTAGHAGKLLLELLADGAIDSAAAQNRANNCNAATPALVSMQYETPNRLLIVGKHIGPDDATVGFVLRRHGLFTWQWSEVRLLELPDKPSSLASR